MANQLMISEMMTQFSVSRQPGKTTCRFGTRYGFTLIEILIVVIILGFLAALVVPRLAGRTEEARLAAAKSDIDGGISLALDLYEADNGKYPNRIDDLLREPSGAKNWKGKCDISKVRSWTSELRLND